MTDAPLILAFDTSGPHVTAALLAGEDILTQRSEEMPRGQAERLLPLLEEVLAEAGKTFTDLTRIAVGTGPGNFTGIRISVAAARGLAMALDIPAIGVSLLDTTQFLSHWSPVAMPAPRGQFYLMDFDKMREPVLIERLPNFAVALSTEHTPAQHVAMMARLAAIRTPGTAPAPLYVKPADAAPSKDAPPVILDDA
ncbi:tRNA threonylcarbamoyl adenosine modification protein YeaZ [Thalassovita litoralis]|jgi:tRNA threonylcarbamoyl adenosine modification protein YeaZ|uniref:tRNA threonylcarbamoyl adenosine modification protein YeaZ n=1 Tax=Thalassovita litoralis TaxID=1010611 RepID=A0A521FF94_9RHOB|nr:tRNA (adenosine(37)-N6)-threonylcarbamoyltransferase complex dimerization subunit type 1 TsaB [Thalassovita litoralis]SMO94809.1 tRNA threonylcarbamoyl adenosine modification protein YeaZ [Thalassovita litoralis]